MNLRGAEQLVTEYSATGPGQGAAWAAASDRRAVRGPAPLFTSRRTLWGSRWRRSTTTRLWIRAWRAELLGGRRVGQRRREGVPAAPGGPQHGGRRRRDPAEPVPHPRRRPGACSGAADAHAGRRSPSWPAGCRPGSWSWSCSRRTRVSDGASWPRSVAATSTSSAATVKVERTQVEVGGRITEGPPKPGRGKRTVAFPSALVPLVRRPPGGVRRRTPGGAGLHRPDRCPVAAEQLRQARRLGGRRRGRRCAGAALPRPPPYRQRPGLQGARHDDPGPDGTHGSRLRPAPRSSTCTGCRAPTASSPTRCRSS